MKNGVKVINHFPGLIALPEGIVHVKQKKNQEYKVSIVPVSAEQIDSFMQMSYDISLLTKEELELWKLLVKLDEKFSTKKSYTKHELDNELPKEIFTFKISYFKVIPEDKGFVKIEALDHIPRLIKYLGPPKYQTSKYFEAIHLPMKTLGGQSNQKNVERYILEQVYIVFCQI